VATIHWVWYWRKVDTRNYNCTGYVSYTEELYLVTNLYDNFAIHACEDWSWGCYAALKLAALVICYCAWWWRAKKFTKTNPPLPPARFLGGSSEWNEEESKDLIELRKRLNEFFYGVLESVMMNRMKIGDDGKRRDEISPKKFLDYIDYQGNSFPVFAIWIGKEELCRNSIGRDVQSFEWV
ncbi:hypothetical protein Goari_012935, partial [Gossypium aridum]|nr:hypothetical protein [Gossypium aridum]